MVSDAIIRPLGYERVYLPLCKLADTPFHIQREDILVQKVIHRNKQEIP